MKKILCAFLCLCMAVSMLPMQTFAAKNYSYVALGDGITTGYGLQNHKNSFAKLVSERGNYIFNDNLADVEATSGDLLKTVNAAENAHVLKSADLVTITIGANDLWNALYSFLADKYNEKKGTNISASDIKNFIMNGESENIDSDLFEGVFSESIASFPESNNVKTAIEAFKTNFYRSVQKIKTINPDVTLIITTQYNPYEYAVKYHVVPDPKVARSNSNDSFEVLVQALDKALFSLNDYITSTGKGLGYDVADIYEAFHSEVENLRNPCFAGEHFTLDFHPNKYGHQVMADVIYTICLHQEFEITASAKTVAFDRASVGYTTTGAKTITIANTGNQSVYISLPTSTNFIIAAAAGFSNNQAFLKPGEKASYTVQPKEGLTAGVYTDKITVTGTRDIIGETMVTFIVENELPVGTVFKKEATGNTFKVTKIKRMVEYKGTSDTNKKVVVVPDSVIVNGIRYTVTAIGNNAFKNNKKVKQIVIGKNVTKIGKKAFYGCKNLKKITIKSTKLKKKDIGAKAFKKAGKKNYNKLKVIVPKKCLKTYKKIFKQKGLSAKAVVK